MVPQEVDVESAGAVIGILKTIVENSFMTAAGLFTAFFMLIVAVLLLKGLRKLDLKGLFVDRPHDHHISSSKFWSNVAYFVATVAFLAINITAPGSASLEFIWVIYLGIVASAAVASKFLALRYNGAVDLAKAQSENRGGYDQYGYGRGYDNQRRRGSRDDGRAQEDSETTEGDHISDLPQGYSDRD